MTHPEIVELFDQILNGWDIPKPEGMLKINEHNANVQLDNLPYSIATNLKHLVFWQDFWLKKLAGGKKKTGMSDWAGDWKVPEPHEWKEYRSRALEGMQIARAIAAGEVPHELESESEAVSVLLQIAIHAAYHFGQINLMKRAIRKGETDE